MYEVFSTDTKPAVQEDKIQTLEGPGDSSGSSFPWGVVGWVAVIGLALYFVSGSVSVSAGLNRSSNPGRSHLRRMDKNEAKRQFETYVLPGVIERMDLGQYGKIDKPMIREAWNDWVDRLQKDGRITEKQAETWSSPYDRA